MLNLGCFKNVRWNVQNKRRIYIPASVENAD